MRNWIIGLLLFSSIQLFAQETKKVVILHHNDTHSRIMPLPENSVRNGGLGGIVRQEAYVESVREENDNVLLFHCGDFVQGTPYFNLFGGAVEVACMNLMHYDAVCLGNHEFDNGLEKLETMLRAARFPVVVSNIKVNATPLEGLIEPYHIFYREGIRIGVIGLLVSPEGLIAEPNYRDMVYLDPVTVANETAAFLKEQKGCDLIICLSHLGYLEEENPQGDIYLAQNSRNIDIILGGHSHTLLQFADRRLNLDGKEVVINQVGDKGAFMGRLDVVLEEIMAMDK
ncbi:MAG: metallophosphoesterase [Candidatus Symbiothrix sp.]|jgi:5'-nucleotidase|nr:metallophosphoesterase [Candidatus Symbiothrix sp.]